MISYTLPVPPYTGETATTHADVNTFMLGRKQAIQLSQRNSKLKSLGYKSYQDYLASFEWWAVKVEKLRRNPCCQKCSSLNDLQVHHISYKAIGKNIGQQMSHLMVLCGEHHMKVHETTSGTFKTATRKMMRS